MRAQQGRSSARSHTLASGSKEALQGQQRSPEQETQGEAWLGSGVAIRLGVATVVCGPPSARAPHSPWPQRHSGGQQGLIHSGTERSVGGPSVQPHAL